MTSNDHTHTKRDSDMTALDPHRPSSSVSTDSHPATIAGVEADAAAASKEKGEGKTGAGADPEVIVLDWEGPDDPGNPRNWSSFIKWRSAVIVSAFTFISPVSSSMIAPCSAQLAEQWGITSTVLLAMTTSVFILGYSFGPLFLGPLSELYGRSRVLQASNMFYLAWNIGCGFAQSKNQLIAFRFLAGLGGSAPLSIGGGVLGDLFTAETRGQAIAVYSLAPLLGPVIGPLTGAWVAEKSTWRWVFWSTSIVDAAVQVAGLFYLKETYPPVLLERRAARMRKSADIEKNVRIITVYQKTQARDWKSVFTKALVRPFALFVYEPIIQLLGVYMAFIYGLLYLFITTIPDIFENTYGERVGIAGLNYLALGVGLTGASQINARLLDYMYRRLTEKRGGKGKPEYRLPSMVPGTILLPVGLFLTGWTARASVHWIVPDIGIAMVGAGVILNFQAIQTYVIDAFTLHSASALAAVAFLRSLCGFGFPLFAPTMYNALGYGKANSILGAVAIVIGCPAPYLFWVYGERIRNASKYAHKS